MTEEGMKMAVRVAEYVYGYWENHKLVLKPKSMKNSRCISCGTFKWKNPKWRDWI
jgi:hypothetical protein